MQLSDSKDITDGQLLNFIEAQSYEPPVSSDFGSNKWMDESQSHFNSSSSRRMTPSLFHSSFQDHQDKEMRQSDKKRKFPNIIIRLKLLTIAESERLLFVTIQTNCWNWNIIISLCWLPIVLNSDWSCMNRTITHGWMNTERKPYKVQTEMV